MLLIFVKCKFDYRLFSFSAPNVQVCSRNDRNLASCIIRSVKFLQPALASGNLGGGFKIPPIEPFFLEKYFKIPAARLSSYANLMVCFLAS